MAAAEDFAEGLPEICIELGKRGGEDLLHVDRELFDDLVQLLLRFFEVALLLAHKSIPFEHLPVFLDRIQIDVSERAHLRAQVFRPLPCGGHIFQRPCGLGRRRGRQLIVFPHFVQDLCFLGFQLAGAVFQARRLALEVQNFIIFALRLAVNPSALALDPLVLVHLCGDLFVQAGGNRPGVLARGFGMRELFSQACDLGLKSCDRVRRAGYARVQFSLELFEVGQCAGFARSLRAVFRDLGLQRRGLCSVVCCLGGELVDRRAACRDLRFGLFIGLPCGRLAAFALGDGVLILLLGSGEVVPLEHEVIILQLQALEQQPMLGYRGAQPGLRLFSADALGLNGLEVVIQCSKLVLGGTEILLSLRAAHLEYFHLFLRIPQAARTGERARAARGRAAGHRAAGLQNLAVQRDDAEAVAVRPGERKRGVHIFGNDRACEQVLHDGRIAFVKSDQPVSGAETAFLRFQTGFPQHIRADGIDRQEGRAAAVRALQIFNAALAVRRRVHHDGGRGRAKRRVDGGDELVLGRDQCGHRAVHTVHRPPLHLMHDRLDRARKAFIIALHVGQHLDAVFGISQRRRCFGQLALQAVHLFAAALRLERHALHLIFRTRKRIQTVAHARFQRLMRLLFAVQPLTRGLDIG